jgi:predicted MFS family arabinose efflux permease
MSSNLAPNVKPRPGILLKRLAKRPIERRMEEMPVAAVTADVRLAAHTHPVNRWLVPRRQAAFAFAMTFLLMTFDFVDRQIVVSMFPALKAEWGLSDKELGGLVSVVSITVALFSFPIALVADRWSRVKSIVAMAVVWSLATIACGLSRSYGQLLTARAVIGLGEAGYGAAGGALLTSMFPAERRATVVGGFLSAAAVGSVLGVILGGVITAQWGWQAAFGVVGIPGLVLALAFLLVRDYRTVPLIDAGTHRMGTAAVLRALFKPRSALAAYAGGALQLLAVSTIYAWLPSYLNRFHGLPTDKAGLMTAIVLILGSIGIVLWGYVADRLASGNARNKMLVPAACMVVTALLLSPAFGLMQPGIAQFALIAVGGFMMTAASGAIPSVAIDVIHPGLRATATAMVVVVQNLFGLAAGPLITGALSDAFGLATALAIMPLFCLASAAVLVAGARFYPADLYRANARAPRIVSI